MLHEAGINGRGYKPRTTRRATLDGMNISNDCFQCDDEAGWADVYVKGPDGKRMKNPDGTFKTKTLVGKVEVAYVPYEPPQLRDPQPGDVTIELDPPGGVLDQ